MPDEEEIIKNVGIASYGFFKAFLNERREGAERFFLRHHIGFVPIGLDYAIFKEIKERSAFKQLKFLIGTHTTLPIVLTGLWINSLSEDQKLNVVTENRNAVYKKYGQQGINILNMCTTGFMEAFIKFLSNYNIKKNITKEEMIEVYENELREWSRTTIFIQKTNNAQALIDKCTIKMGEDLPFFYMFASYGAVKIGKDIVNSLSKNGVLRNYNYEVTEEKLNAEGTNKVWIFEKNSMQSFRNFPNEL